MQTSPDPRTAMPNKAVLHQSSPRQRHTILHTANNIHRLHLTSRRLLNKAFDHPRPQMASIMRHLTSKSHRSTTSTPTPLARMPPPLRPTECPAPGPRRAKLSRRSTIRALLLLARQYTTITITNISRVAEEGRPSSLLQWHWRQALGRLHRRRRRGQAACQ